MKTQCTNFEYVTDQELLKMIVRETSPGAFEELLKGRSMPELIYDTTKEELLAVKGIGSRTMQQLLAVQVLVKRLMRDKGNGIQVKVTTSKDVYDIMRFKMVHLLKEEFHIILLNTKNEVIREETISIGTLNASLVHGREVFRSAIKAASNSIILCHNHPSGNPTPSNEDKALTKRLVEAGKIIGIEVLDHVIVGSTSYYSFKENDEI